MNISKCSFVMLCMALFLFNATKSFSQTGCHQIDWETDCSGNPFPEGFYVTSDAYDCIGVTITNNLTGANPLVLFNSSDPTGGDIDLGTPSSNCPTCTGSCPGVSNNPNGGLTNCVDQHLILITEENPIDANSDGLEDNPDDHNVTDLTYDFVAPVTISSLSFVDDSQGTITFTFSDNTTNTVTLTGGLDNDVYTQVFNESDVVSVDLTLSSSGAVSVADFCYDVPGAPPCDLVAPVLGADVNICAGDDPGPIEVLTSATSSVTPITYQWNQSLTGCNGFGPIPGATGPTYNPGVLVQTTYFNVVVTTNDGSQTCIEESNCISYIEQTCNTCTVPVVTAEAIPPTCEFGVMQSNGYLEITNLSVGDAYHWSLGSTFDDNGGANTYSNAADISGTTFPIQLASGQSNPSGSQDYTIRVYNGDNTCFQDEVLTMNEQNINVVCECSTTLNYTELSCNDNGDGTFTTNFDAEVSWAAAPAGEALNVILNGATIQTIAAGATAPQTISFSLPADGSGVNLLSAVFATTTTCGDTMEIKGPLPCPTNVGACSGATGCLAGNAFEDFNYNGVDDVNEPGVTGVIVNVYDINNVIVGTTWTDSEGDWEVCSLTDGDQYRIEFTLSESVACWAAPTPTGGDNNSDVQFVTAPACTKFSLSSPGDYCQTNPDVLISCFVNGESGANGTADDGDSFVSFPYQSNGETGSPGYTGTPSHLSHFDTTGVVWGVGYDKIGKRLFTSAAYRRHAGFGPLGTGGIYMLDYNNAAPFFTNYLDLAALGVNTGIDTRTPFNGLPLSANELPNNTSEKNWDTDAFDKVGRSSLGDIEVSDDGSTLYVVNIENTSIVTIDISGANPVLVSEVVVPPPAGCLADDFYIWGLTVEKAALYIGGVCTAETSGNVADLKGFVLKQNGTSFQTIATIPFDYDRRDNATGNGGGDSNWKPWTATYQTQGTGSFAVWPQPIISDIEFEADGSIILGIMDRNGMQMGSQNYATDPNSTSLVQGISSGDILKICNGVLESNGTCGGVTTIGTGDGDGYSDGTNNGEFYWGDQFDYNAWTNPITSFATHAEIGFGSLLLLKGLDETMMTSYNPTQTANSGGVIILNNTTGGRNSYYGSASSGTDFGYRLYTTTGGDASSFSKSNGLGDIEAGCDPAPLEIGNYVWIDTNFNGIQDANEMGVDGLIVQLYDAAGVLVGQDTTSNNGQYYFNESNVDLTGISVSGGMATPNTTWSGMDYATQYYIVFGDSQFSGGTYTVGSDTYDGTTVNDVNSNNNDNVDSDVDGNNLSSSIGAMPAGLPFIDMTTAAIGQANHSYDLGLTPTPPTFSIGNYIWVDEDGDGDQDAGEMGIPGIPVNLYDNNNVLLETVYTDFNGGYIFENLAPGDYTITVDDTQLPTGLENPTFDLDGTLDHTTTVTVTEENLEVDFGYNYAPPVDTNSPAGTNGAIGDRIWSDDNSDGIQDQGEPGIENVTVNLLDDTGNVISTTTTDAAGYFVFDNLPAGVYSVEVDDSTLPSGFTTTPTGDPDGDNTNDSEEIILGPGDVYLDMDFGYNNPTSYNIGDKVFVDVNANGVEDAGELPIPGVTVTLIADTNGNGIWDAGEMPIANTTTDTNGNYLFTGVTNGDYIVVITDTNDVTAAMTNSADPDGGANEYSAVTIAGADDLTQDFGYTPEGHTATDGIIGDFIFLDTNGDDAQTAGEPGIEDVIVELYDNSNSLIATTTTDPNGMYLFGSLPAGTYTVKVDPTSLPAAGSIPASLTQSVDPDGGNDNESTTTIATGGQDLDQDFGYKATTPNTITGTIWEDTDANGTLDETTPNLFENITVELRDDQGNLVGTTLTDANGDFTFEGLPDGTYTVDVTDDQAMLGDYWKSNGPTPGANNNSQDDTNTVSVAGGATDETSDFGYYTAGASLGNYVWEDTNLDGIQDSGEPALQGVVVTLEITYPDGTIVTTTDVTDANGHYSFDNLLLDEDYNTGGGGAMPTYTLSAAAPSNYIATTVDANSNGNDLEDSEDPTGVIAIPTQGQKEVIANVDPNLEDPIASYDFGFGLQATYNIGNFVWLDEDGDGDQDAGEIGIGGVPVYLEDNTGAVIATTITDFNGGYLFEDLQTGTYTVVVDDTKLPAGLQNQTFDNDGILDNESTVILSTDDDLMQDFGYNYAPPTDTNNPASSLGALGDRIWSDANGDGMQDPNEVGIGGVTVNLLDDAGAVIGTTTTDDVGYYIFDNLPAGVYSIEVDATTLPARFTTTPTGDPDGDMTNVSDPIPLAPGDVHMNMDFGYNDPSAYNLGDRIYLDANVSGAEDAGELPIPNVTVALIADTNGNGMWDIGELPIATDITDANGNYLFSGLGNGDYVVVVTNSNNVLAGLDNTADPDGGLNGYAGVTIAGADDLTQDFGYAPEGHTSADGILGDLVFLDADRDGTYSAGDSGLEGIGVILYNSAGEFIGSTTTDVNGNYLFGGLPADTYTVEVGVASIPAGLTNNVDPDGGNDDASQTTLAAGGQDLDQDFGYEATIPNTISGTLWEDRDAVGDLNEPSPVFFEDVTVVLKDANGNVIATTTTDSNGDYSFTGLPDGTYTIEVTDDNNILNGHWLSDGASDGANNNSQENNYSVSVAGGSTNDTGDFGYYIDGASLGNYVWDDTNEDGIQDPGEQGIPGVVVTLVIDYPDGTSLTLTETTDATGFYSFENLLLDEDYNTGGGGTMPTFTLSAATPNGYQTTIIDTNGNGSDGVDSEDPAGASAIPTQGLDDTNPNSSQVIAYYDFGFSPIPLPVTLISFEVSANDCNAELVWRSEVETDFSHYIVERSKNGSLTFEYLTKVEAKQNAGIKSYSFEDIYVTGKAFYRLKMLNLDGTYSYSNIVAVETDCENDVSGIQLYPNPIGSSLTTINMTLTSKSESVAWMVITDNLGKEHMRFPASLIEGENIMGIDISNLASGSYFISIISENGKTKSKQFVKVAE